MKWRVFGKEKWTIQGPCFSYCIPFYHFTEVTEEPVRFPLYSYGLLKTQALQGEVIKCCQKLFLRSFLPIGPTSFSRLFLMGRASSSWRVVTVLSLPNAFMPLPNFKWRPYPQYWSPRGEKTLCPLWIWRMHISKIPDYPESSPYLWLSIKRTIFYYKALCSGLSTTPQVFTKVFKLVWQPMSQCKSRTWNSGMCQSRVVLPCQTPGLFKSEKCKWNFLSFPTPPAGLWEQLLENTGYGECFVYQGMVRKCQLHLCLRSFKSFTVDKLRIPVHVKISSACIYLGKWSSFCH